MPLVNLETPDRSKPYSYENDSLLNRHLGEPVDYDWAGAIREKTLRWRWQYLKSRIQFWWLFG